MITRTRPQWRTTPQWQQELSEAVRDPDEFIRLLQLPESLRPAAHRAAARFALRVPRGYLARMEKGNPADPLVRQVLPVAAECTEVEGFRHDPVGDLEAMVDNGVIHKYRGRVLLTVTGACAVHCRYCFRRHFPYGEANPARQQWQAALAYLRAHDEVTEVILSGGDPLSLSDEALHALVEELEAIPHLHRLRIHTRQPVVLPSRVDDGLLRWLAGTRLQAVVVLHANHPNELDDAVHAALAELKPRVDALLNQSVLLGGVNDDVQTLVQLSHALFEMGVLPYYLHLLDPVQGAAHFDVPLPRACDLHRQISAQLPGYLVPRLVREINGEPAKSPMQGAQTVGSM